MTTIDKATRANRRLPTGKLVVSKEDGEPGRVVQVCTSRRNGIDAWSYLVETRDGQEIWDASDVLLPTGN